MPDMSDASAESKRMVIYPMSWNSMTSMAQCALAQVCCASHSVSCRARAPQLFSGTLASPGESGPRWRARMGLHMSSHTRRERSDVSSREMSAERSDGDSARVHD
eukprot:9334553-Alexandrium_andersonii.AAC.1